jgi:hypothetical protein
MSDEEVEEFVDDLVGNNEINSIYLINGMGKAFIGIDVNEIRAVYSIELCEQIFMKKHKRKECIDMVYALEEKSNFEAVNSDQATPLFINTIV